jgi:hypothetical protein
LKQTKRQGERRTPNAKQSPPSKQETRLQSKGESIGDLEEKEEEELFGECVAFLRENPCSMHSSMAKVWNLRGLDPVGILLSIHFVGDF